MADKKTAAKAKEPQKPTVEEELAATKEALRIQEEAAVDAEDRIAELEAQTASLSAKAEAAGPATDLPKVEVDGKNYAFQFPAAIYQGKKVTAEDAKIDPDILADLVKIKSGWLKAL